MHVEELNLEELQHEHPLTLVDLQLMLRDYEEDDEDYDEKELIRTQNFECICSRCDKRIDWYHRYYYKCSISSCNYSLHKFCEEMPTTLKFQGHPSHTLILKKTTNDHKCHGCFKHYRDGICYHCSTCDYGIDLLCATFVERNTTHHPGHSHPLISISVEPNLSKCFACGKKHEGHFYHCITCFNFSINFDCLSLPTKLLLHTQQFSHPHLLTLSYSILDQLYDCECRICGLRLEDGNFIYMCSKCLYYVHPDCATQRILSPGLGKTNKNYKDVDHPRLLHFPLAEESPLLSQVELETRQIVIPERVNKITSTSRVSLHDPMKRIKLLCTICTRPITKFPFYKFHDDELDCYFEFHDWCIGLPNELSNHVGHPHHTLWLEPLYISGKICNICGLPFNGFSYHCREETCMYWIDVNCAFIPQEITHEAHANHLLTRVYAASSSSSSRRMECRACRVSIDDESELIYFRCNACDFFLDCRCALHLPKTIRNKCDRHLLQMSYSPIEDHRSEYFCEVCEEGLDPGKWFYHCVKCAQSVHSACAPLILQSEQGVNSLHVEGVYKFINILFGFQIKQPYHQHPVSLAPGTENDGLCPICRSSMQSNMIWKCSDCSFAMHHVCIVREEGDTITPIDEFGGTKRMIQHQPKRNMEFYPAEVIMMRPVTRHYEVIDDDI